uniref:Uncharacterized protein n=1 Tax=Phakopsora pachyrhizi TaxID=170000 RepID=A0A0S1MJD6_PHAPC
MISVLLKALWFVVIAPTAPQHVLALAQLRLILKTYPAIHLEGLNITNFLIPYLKLIC